MSQNIIESYQQWLELKKLGTRTIKEYSRYYLTLDRDNLTQEYFQIYLQKHNNQVARSFLNSYLTYLKLANFSKEIKEKASSIILPKISGRRKKLLPNIVTESEVYLIESSLPSEKYKLMLLISFYCGLRDSELVGQYAIKPYSFQWTSWLKNPLQVGIIKILGKGNKHRYIMCPPKLMGRIYQWITTDIIKTQNKEEKLFNIGDRRWRVVLSQASKKTLDRHINPHLLRHSCSIWLKQKGLDILDRREYLGHESVTTTIIYDRVDITELSKKYENALINQ